MMKVLIADDHRLVRESIGVVLSSCDDIEVETAGTMHEASAKISENGPFDLVLLDYDMPGVGDLDGLKKIINQKKEQRIALFSGTANNFIVSSAFQLGAVGFVPKTLSPDSLVHAVRLMAGGERYLPAELMMQTAGAAPVGKSAADALTERELQMLEGLCEGMSNKELAGQYGLQEVTVKMHVKTLCRKLGARNRTHAAMLGKELGLF